MVRNDRDDLDSFARCFAYHLIWSAFCDSAAFSRMLERFSSLKNASQSIIEIESEIKTMRRYRSILVLLGVLSFTPLLAEEALPKPDPAFQGKIGETYKDSQADPSPFSAPSAPQGAPNVLLVLIDDIGFGASSTLVVQSRRQRSTELRPPG